MKARLILNSDEILTACLEYLETRDLRVSRSVSIDYHFEDTTGVRCPGARLVIDTEHLNDESD